MANQINVAVIAGSECIEECVRPIRLLPDRQTVGVVYQRVVYPLRLASKPDGSPLHFINVVDAPHAKHDCDLLPPSRALTPTGREDFLGISVAQPPSVPPSFGWYLESNSYGHYVLFDGDRNQLDRVTRALRDHGLSYLRAAASYRPADNGRTYQWFVRLATDEDDHVVVRADVAQALALTAVGTPASATAPGNASPDEDLLRPKVDALEQILAEMQTKVAQRDQRAVFLERELTDAHAALKAAKEAHASAEHARYLLELEGKRRAELLASLQQRHEEVQRDRDVARRLLEQERTKAAASSPPRRVVSPSNVLKPVSAPVAPAAPALESARQHEALSESRAEIDRLQIAAEQLKQEADQKTAEVVLLDQLLATSAQEIVALERQLGDERKRSSEDEALIEQLEANCDDFRRKAMEPEKSGKSGDLETLSLVARQFLPRLVFSRGSVDEIIARDLLQTASGLWRCLREVNDYRDANRQEAAGRWTSICNGWQEFDGGHFSDGQQDRLRVYRQLNGDKIRIEVFYKGDSKKQRRLHERFANGEFTPSRLEL